MGSLLYSMGCFNYGAARNLPGKHHEQFQAFFVKNDKISGISSTKLTLPYSMCYSLFGNGVCNGVISINTKITLFINDEYKVNTIGQVGKS